MGIGGRLSFTGVVALRVVFLQRRFWDTLWLSGNRGFFEGRKKGGGGNGFLRLTLVSLGVEVSGPTIQRFSGRT